MDEPSVDDVNKLLGEMAASMSTSGSTPAATTVFRSEYNTEQRKYAGPYAIVSYEGPRIRDPNHVGLDAPLVMVYNKKTLTSCQFTYSPRSIQVMLSP
jgi:hypothetical protein